MEEKKVFVVTAGHYSDYHIVGIFGSKEKAEEYIQYSDECELNDIEELELNAEIPNRNDKVYAVKMLWNEGECTIDSICSGDSKYKGLIEYVPREYNYLRLFVTADTRGRAIKIAADRFRQIKVEEQTRYPLLRRPCTVRDEDGYKHDIYPAYDYHTGEIVLRKGQKLMSYTIPAEMEHTVRVRNLG